MTIFEITALLMVLTALFSFINYRVLHMPTTIGVMFIALAASLGIVVLSWIGVVVFSIGIQGMTLGRVVAKVYRDDPLQSDCVRP